MATPICQLCGENPAQQMMTNLETGESLAICADDFPTFVLGLAEKMMEAGQIELPEPEAQDPTEGAGSTADTDLAPLADDMEASEALGGPTTAGEASGPANVKRTPARTRAGNGRSPAPSSAAPTETVAPESGETADSPVSAPAN